MGIVDRVNFVGRVDPDQIASEYAQAEVFCGLSRSEALGNVFIEAQAAGCAVLGTNIGGIPDIVKNEETGLLIDPDNVSDAAVSLGRLLGDSALREKLSQAGINNAQKYGWSVIAASYQEVYLS